MCRPGGEAGTERRGCSRAASRQCSSFHVKPRRPFDSALRVDAYRCPSTSTVGLTPRTGASGSQDVLARRFSGQGRGGGTQEPSSFMSRASLAHRPSIGTVHMRSGCGHPAPALWSVAGGHRDGLEGERGPLRFRCGRGATAERIRKMRSATTMLHVKRAPRAGQMRVATSSSALPSPAEQVLLHGREQCQVHTRPYTQGSAQQTHATVHPARGLTSRMRA